MKTFFWAAGNDGSSFYRQTLPSLSLQWRGHTAMAGQQMAIQTAMGCDVIVGARVAMPAALVAWQRLADAGKALILDMDDDYFSIDRSNVQAHAFWDNEMRANLVKAMDLASLVTAVSEPLAERLRARTDTPVVVVPNGLPAQYLSAPRVYSDDGPVCVGWAGSSSTIHELPKVARTLSRIGDFFPAGQVTVKLVGINREEAASKGLVGRHVAATGWIPDVPRYLKECMAFDIWVAPYRDTRYNRAKFATKALEASMLGIPLLASDIEPYRDWVASHGSTCGVQLVTDDYRWSRYLISLIRSADLRRSIGLDASATASKYVLQSLGGVWEEALKQAVRRAGMKGAIGDRR